MLGINLACHEKLILWLEKMNEKRTSSLNGITPAIIEFFSKHLTELNNQPNRIIGAPIENWRNSALNGRSKVTISVLNCFVTEVKRRSRFVPLCVPFTVITNDENGENSVEKQNSLSSNPQNYLTINKQTNNNYNFLVWALFESPVVFKCHFVTISSPFGAFQPWRKWKCEVRFQYIRIKTHKPRSLVYC